MEENKEMKNGIISEEALDQIAGGLNVNKAALITVLIASGITIGGGLTFAYKKGWIGGKKDDGGKKDEPSLNDGHYGDIDHYGMDGF